MKTNLLKKSVAALMIVGVGFAYSCNGGGTSTEVKTDSTAVVTTTPETAVDTTHKMDSTTTTTTDTTKKM